MKGFLGPERRPVFGEALAELLQAGDGFTGERRGGLEMGLKSFAFTGGDGLRCTDAVRVLMEKDVRGMEAKMRSAADKAEERDMDKGMEI